MHSRTTLECPLSSWRTLVPGSTPELIQADRYCRCWVLSTNCFAVQVFSCLTSQCWNIEVTVCMRILNRKQCCGLRRLLFAPVWEVHWRPRSRIREVNSSARYHLSSSPFCSCSVLGELKILPTVSVKATEQACSSCCVLDKLPGSQEYSVQASDGISRRAVCSMTFQCVPK